MATYAIVFSAGSGALRRTIADDDGNVHIQGPPDQKAVVIVRPGGEHIVLPLAPGEDAIMENAPPHGVQPHHYDDWIAAIKRQTGKDPDIGMAALLDANNIVTAVIHADPDVDAPPQGVAMVRCYSPRIGTGCSYDPATGLFSTPPGVIPPHMPGNGTDQPIDVPPQVIPKP